jgi:hypothetical protein
MAALDLFPSRIRFVDDGGRLTPEAVRALSDVFARIGGSTGPSTTDLAQTDDDDSALEEFKHEAAKSLDGLGLTPAVVFDPFTDPLHPLAQQHSEMQHLLTELAGLREEVSMLRRQITDLSQGTML